MGINYEATLMVGRYNNDSRLKQDLYTILEIDPDEDDVYDELDARGLDYVSPYYDSYMEDRFIGIPIQDPEDTSEESLKQLGDSIKAAAIKFKEVTGVDAVVETVPDIW